MEIIVDETIGLWGDPGIPGNTPEDIINRRKSFLKLFGEFCGADSIEYKETDKGEVYKVHKNGSVLILDVVSNRYDGGWILFNLNGKEK